MPRLVDLPFHFLERGAPNRVVWLGLPLLLYAWTITGPYIADDYMLILRAERFLRGEAATPDAYRIATRADEWRDLRDRGSLLWWLPDDGRLDYLRPVSGLGVAVDAFLARRNPLISRLIGLVVFVAALGSVHWLFAVAGQDRTRAGAAALLFGVSQTLTPPVTWLNNRQDLWVIIGASLAAGAYWKAYESGRWRWLPVAAGAFAFALLAKEMAVGLAAVLGLHALLWMRKREPSPGRSRSVAIAVTLVGMVGIFLSYYLWSRPWLIARAGADGLPSQVGPQAALSFALYAALWSLGFPIDALHLAPEYVAWVIAAVGSGATIVALRFLPRACRGDRAALFFALWAVAFLLPGLRAFSPPSARTASTATVGWAYLLVLLILPARSGAAAAPGWLRHLLFITNGSVNIGCVIATVLIMNHGERATREQLMQVVARLDPALADGDVVLIPNGASNGGMPFAAERLEFLSGRRDGGVIYLLPPEVEAAFEWIDRETLRVRARGASLLGAPIHRITRGRGWRPGADEIFLRDLFDVRVTRVDEHGGVLEMTLTLHPSAAGRRLRLAPELEALRP